MIKLGLRARLIVLIAFICAVCILAVAFISTNKSKTALMNMAQDQLESSSITMKSQIESYLSSSKVFTERLAKNRLVEGLFIAYEGAFYGGGFSTDKDEKIITSTYTSNEKLYGERTRNLAKDFGFSNIMLGSVNGQILMTSLADKKYNFLGRSITKGLLKGSNLTGCFNAALNGKKNTVHFADFQLYKSSKHVHSFLCKKISAEFDHEDEGIYKGDTLGVVIAELSNTTLAAITGQRTGMGKTGQTYLIGPDNKLRSDFSINKDKYNMRNSFQKNLLIKTKSVTSALKKKQGINNIVGPNESDVMSVYSPLTVFGNTWAFIAEKDLEEITSPVTDMIIFISIGAVILFAIILVIGLFVARVISSPIISANDNLTNVSSDVAENSEKIKSYSGSLNDYSGELSSSIQETVTTMDELTQMVNKNLDNVQQSETMSQRSQQVANDGLDTVKSMLNAMNDINLTNENIGTEMDEINKQMIEIISVIEEIANKTTVINDIVFQTKLLSFNASVEAARAGEHGKGFSVVAEEVGNLATASGKAATEISDMLSSSVSKVQTIIDTTKNKIDAATSGGKEKVEVGQKVAKECGEKLEEILSNVNQVNQTVSEVKLASDEQAAGIKEVSKAMQRLDQVCADTQQIANEVLNVSSVLENGSDELYNIVGGLNSLISGKSEIELDKPKVKEKEVNIENFSDEDFDDDDTMAS